MRRAWTWFVGVPAPDPVARRHAPSVLVLCALGVVALLAGELVRWHSGTVLDDLAVATLRLTGAGVLAAAFVVIRTGRFRQGVTLFVAGAVLISACGVALTGFAANSRNLTELTMPLALAALLLGRRALWTSMAAYAVGFSIGGLRDEGYLLGLGPQEPANLPFGGVATAIIAFAVVSIVLDRVGLSLREGFDLALGRQRELERKGAELSEANEALRAEMARRQAAEERLLEAQKMEAVSRLSGGVAHDFNNLLTVILGCAEMSKSSLPEDHAARAGLEEIAQAAERAADLTRQLLAFARRQLVEPKSLRVDDNLRSTQKMFARLLREDIRLEVVPGAPEWKVLIDHGQLDQVIINLVVNARDAMPEGGSLTIRTREQTLLEAKESALFSIAAGDYVVIEVSDTGTGIDPEIQRRVFEPFFTTKGGTRGTGLGLATCYGIVAQAGGGIFFETGVDQGTTFEVFLPRSTNLRDTSPERDQSRANAARGETVLVVEDEGGVRRITSRALRDAGYKVLEAATLADAVRVATESNAAIQLLITDLVLPDGGGGEVARRISELCPAIRVLYVSGHTDDPALRRDIREREVEFLAKPFSPDQLTTRARRVLDRPHRKRTPAQ